MGTQWRENKYLLRFGVRRINGYFFGHKTVSGKRHLKYCKSVKGKITIVKCIQILNVTKQC